MATSISDPTYAHAWIQQRGDSLSPTIEPGDWVEVDPNVTTFVGPGIYLTAWNDFEPKPHHPKQFPQLRRLAFIDGELHSAADNPFYPPFKVKAADLLIGGKVVEH
ncbi:MAG: S24 family peptidase [Xanthomonadaceae bacterium]|nr:S24 family peptidase [Xanthomonadaceae bacterium]